MKKWLINLAYPVFVAIAIIFIWYITSVIINVDIILPSPFEAFRNIFNYLVDLDFWVSVGYTLSRCLISFFVSFFTALILAILAFKYYYFKKIIDPLMSFIRAVPTMSIILILIIVFSPNTAPIIVSFIVICPTLYQNFYASINEVDIKIIEMVNFYKVPIKRQILKFYVPTLFPSIVLNSSSGFSLNFKLVIAAEALAQCFNSIGNLMQYAKINIEIEKLFALTIICVIFSFIFEFLIKLLLRGKRYD